MTVLRLLNKCVIGKRVVGYRLEVNGTIYDIGEPDIISNRGSSPIGTH